MWRGLGSGGWGAVMASPTDRYYALAVLSHRLGFAQRFKLVAVVAAELLFALSQISVLAERAIRPQFHALDCGSDAFGEFVAGQLASASTSVRGRHWFQPFGLSNCHPEKRALSATLNGEQSTPWGWVVPGPPLRGSARQIQ